MRRYIFFDIYLQIPDPSGLVKAVLYSSFRGNEATKYGHNMEAELERWFIEQYPATEVVHMGLSSHPKFKYMAGSPDGIGIDTLSDERFLLEYKAPYGLKTSETSVYNAPDLIPSFFLAKKDGQLTLKKRHDFYFQIQGLLEVFDLPYCMLVVAGFDSKCAVRVERDRDVFERVMLPKLRQFYFGAILPERVYPMKRRGGLRSTLVPVEQMDFAE